MRFRLAHISDLHVLSPEGVHWRELLFNKRVTGWANTRLRRGRVFRRRHLEAVLNAASRADHVVITGDVTNLALDGEYREAVRLLDRRAGAAEVTIVPGNHDLYLSSMDASRRDSSRIARSCAALASGSPAALSTTRRDSTKSGDAQGLVSSVAKGTARAALTASTPLSA